jgi:ATP-dependent helicase HrpA
MSASSPASASIAATDLGKIAQHLKSISQSLDASCLARDAEKARTLITAIQQRAARKQPFDRSLAELTALLERSMQLVDQRKLSVPKLTFDDALPIAQKRDDIATLIQSHQVVIVCGETGSGKTTQIPKIALSMGLGTRGLIGCTQPRRLAARSLASRLNYEITGSREDHPFVGYKIRFADKTSPQSLVKVMTDGILLAELASDPLLSAYDTLVIDEAHERSLNIDFLLGIIKRLLPKRPDLKLIVTSATIDTERFSQFFGGAPVIEVSGRTYPVDIRYRPELKQSEDDDGQDMNLGIVRAAEELVREGPGDILVFLPGEREIREAADELRRSTIRHIDILPLFSRLSNEEQDRIFKPGGTRRIVLATNVAETSLTVPGIRYVIDTGVARINRYDSRSKVGRVRGSVQGDAAAWLQVFVFGSTTRSISVYVRRSPHRRFCAHRSQRLCCACSQTGWAIRMRSRSLSHPPRS